MRVTERWDLEVGGRGGIATHGIFVYGLAGIGWVHREVEIGTPGIVTTASGTAMGVLAGAGVELGLRAALHLFVQYEVASWDDVTLKMPAATPQFDYVFGRHDHTLRIGVIVPIKR
jgi:opacity protein-like surface antigen